MPETLTLTRVELYSMVWEKQLKTLTAELGLARDDLSTACDELEVPRPARSHWGFPPERRPLPPPLTPRAAGEPESITLTPTVLRFSRSTDVLVPDEADDSEPAWIATTRNALSKCEPDEWGRVWLDKRLLSVRVAPRNLKLAMSVMSELIHHIEANGWRISIVRRGAKPRGGGSVGWPTNCRYATTVQVAGFPIEISLDEPSTTNRRKATSEERARLKLSDWVTYVEDHKPTGKLRFRIHGTAGSGTHHQWTETPARPLEDQIPNIIRGLASVPGAMAALEAEENARAAEYARENRRRREAETRAAEVARRVAELVAMAERHREATGIRTLVASTLSHHAGAEGLTEWAAWATSVANRMDPLTSGDKFPPFSVP